uniref:RING-type domain-containing protein n=1 Tax=Noctiluca scintillans TaxID=2966 RepID=A0A7S0ZR69_NOCSC
MGARAVVPLVLFPVTSVCGNDNSTKMYPGTYSASGDQTFKRQTSATGFSLRSSSASSKALVSADLRRPAGRRGQSTSCSTFTDCSSCAKQWPTCAWCATSGTCHDSPSEVVAVVEQAEEAGTQTHVIYDRASYTETYGESASSYQVDTEWCGVWFQDSSSCGHVEDYCARGVQGSQWKCENCVYDTGCGLCYHPAQNLEAASTMCLAGLSRDEFAFGTGDTCEDSGGNWFFHNWTQYYADGTSPYPCMASCSASTSVGGASGWVSLGQSTSSVTYEPLSECSWTVTPDPGADKFYVRLRGDLLALQDAVRLYELMENGSEVLLLQIECTDTSPCENDLGTTLFYVPSTMKLTFVSQARTNNEIGWWIMLWGDWDTVWGDAYDEAHETTATTDAAFVFVVEETKSFSDLYFILCVSFFGLMSIPISILALYFIWRRRRNQRVDSVVNVGVSVETLEEIERDLPSLRPTRFQSRGPSASEQPCSVCMNSFADGDEIRTLLCQHVFHKECIDTWLARRSECPVCRAPLRAAPRQIQAASGDGGTQTQTIGMQEDDVAPAPPEISPTPTADDHQ